MNTQPPFAYRQRVSLAKWDKTQPKWARFGICEVFDQEHDESGWMVTVQANDGAWMRLDSGWMEATPNTPPKAGQRRSTDPGAITGHPMNSSDTKK